MIHSQTMLEKKLLFNREPSAQNPAISKRRFGRAAVHAQRSAVRCGRKRTANVSHEIRDFFRRRKPFEQRRWTYFFKKFFFKFRERFAAA
jgi:hypothetical protein